MFPQYIVIAGNNCSPNPCQNGGICVETSNSYACFCAQGKRNYKQTLNKKHKIALKFLNY